jgi:anti-anti-sigma regulatory factor
LYGDLDGSTACQALEAVANLPVDVREVVVHLEGLRSVESFGLDVLRRGIRGRARGRVVRLCGADQPEPAAWLP